MKRRSPLSLEHRTRISDTHKQLWQDPEYREMMKKNHKGNTSHRTNEQIELLRNAAVSFWSDPENHEKMSRIRKGKKRPPFSDEHRRKLSDSHKGKRLGVENPRYGKPLTEETRRKIGEKAKERWKNKETREKMLNAARSDVKIAKLRDSKVGENNPNYGKHPSEETRQKMSVSHSGQNNWSWLGGISFEPYCPKFNNTFKERVRNAFDRKCFLCGALENNKRHFVHHIDYNKNSICNGKEWAFVPLCNSCHSKTNNNRWYWFNLLINYWSDPMMTFKQAQEGPLFG